MEGEGINEEIAMLRRGEIVKLTGSEKKGVIIDWGVYHQTYKKYMLTKKDTADSIRVWTGGAIEVWPLTLIRTDINTQ